MKPRKIKKSKTELLTNKSAQENTPPLLRTELEDRPNTTLLNESFSDEVKRLVWEKGIIIKGLSPDEYRRDICGNIIAWSEYGNRQSDQGWEIDHIVPKAMRTVAGFELLEFDNINNLQPLFWRNNASKSDHFPWPYPPYEGE
jgi:hypothetical protein